MQVHDPVMLQLAHLLLGKVAHVAGTHAGLRSCLP